VVRGGVEPPTFRFSGQPREALCRPAKTVVTDERSRTRRKVQHLRLQDPIHPVHQAGQRPTRTTATVVGVVMAATQSVRGGGP
jgi:hypothetical protein